MRVLFLINNGFGIGGTIRTTFNLAGGLARRGHDVEVLSLFRHRDGPQLPVDPAVRLTALVETRTSHPDYDPDPLRGAPAVVYPKDDARAGEHDLMVERRLARYLRHSDAEVVIATRAGLIASVVHFAPEHMIRIGQEHLTRSMYGRGMRSEMAPYHRALDAFVTVTGRDAQAYRSALRLRDTRLVFLPNSVPAPRVPPSDGGNKIIIAAGRFVGWKRFDLLIKAFATVVGKHPDWQLRVYGDGRRGPHLRQLVTELGLHNNVLMMGGFSPLESEWAKASVAVSPSSKEPFGMTLVEAMRCGLPVVSTDAPHGPREIIDDGVDGLLTPVGKVDAMADALLEVLGDPERRRRMAAAALQASERFDPDTLARRYEELFSRIAADKAQRVPLRRLRRSTAEVLTPAAWPERLIRFRRRGLRPKRWPQRYRKFVGRRAYAQGRDLPPVVVLGPTPHHTLPTADVVVRADGTLELRLDVAAPGGTAPASTASADTSALLWRQAGKPDGTRFPMPPGEFVVGGSSVDLPEGRWELFVALPDGELQPVVAGVRDTRALLAGAGAADAGQAGAGAAGAGQAGAGAAGAGQAGGEIAVRLPYRTPAGFLAVQVWRRRVHAEVGDIELDPDAITVSGRLIGAAFGGGAVEVLLRRPASADRPEVTTVRVPATPLDDARFRAALPIAGFTGHRVATTEQWELLLSFAAEVPPVRLGRILDDVHNKQVAYVFGEVQVPPDGSVRAARVAPAYSAQNELNVRVSDPTP